jgi:endonuclease/exonuclease/phosphatase family metal-dependent hydrolase
MASVAELAVDPRTRGMLGAVGAGTLPASINLRTTGEGVRIASVNIHMAIPAGLGFDLANENLSALRDVSRFINAANPDVVLIQELRNRPVAAAMQQGGLGDTASLLGRFIDADDMAYTPAITQDPFTTPHEFYGTAIYTRNGFTIEQAINARLPNSGPQIERRSVGVASVLAPDARGRTTVLGTHLANEPFTDQPLRDAQLGAIGTMVDGIRARGGFSYVDAITGEQLVASGFPGERVFLAGDFNQVQALTDPILHPHGLVNVNDALASTGELGAARARLADVGTAEVDLKLVPGAKPGDLHRIDLAYQSGMDVTDVGLGAVQRHEFDGDATDHLGLVVDLA